MDSSRIYYLAERATNDSIDYLLLYDRRYVKKRCYSNLETLQKLDLNEPYAINLYPAIWNKRFFMKCVVEGESPWSFEPKLTNLARENNAICFYSKSGSFDILDVVRKGKILHKDNKYFRKNNIIIDRPLVKRSTEFK